MGIQASDGVSAVRDPGRPRGRAPEPIYAGCIASGRTGLVLLRPGAAAGWRVATVGTFGVSRMKGSVACAVPVIDTPRLRLRGHCRDDLPRCLAMWSDPDVTRFIGVDPANEQRTWARLLGYVGHWALMGFGYWVIEQRDSGEFVGEAGLA